LNETEYQNLINYSCLRPEVYNALKKKVVTKWLDDIKANAYSIKIKQEDAKPSQDSNSLSESQEESDNDPDLTSIDFIFFEDQPKKKTKLDE
jgi:hypothetical protein